MTPPPPATPPCAAPTATRATTRRRASSKKRGSGDVYADRRKRLGAALRDEGVDALLITNPRDIRYLCPFTGEASSAVVRTSGRMTVVSDFRFEEDVAPLKPAVSVVMRRGDMTSALVDLLGGLKGDRVGVQSEYMRVSERRALAKGVGAKRLKDTKGVVSALREIKDAQEIAHLRRAVKVQQEAMEATLAELRPGQSEFEIAARLEYEMRVRGSEEPAFGVIVAARANGSKPHAVPGRTKAGANQPVLFDWGATVEGYRSDMTRTVALGRWPRKVREVYEVVREAQLTAIDAVGPGVACSEVDGVARGVIERAGFGPRFGHSLGHGIGLDIHEAPSLSKLSRAVLKPGMVVTIEPGIYLPGVGGVRIEDDIVVTERGHTNLCSLPTDIEWATR